MHDLDHALARLRRPPLLVRAARHGAARYDRTAVLPALLGPGPLPKARAALAHLLAIEADENENRRARAIGYRAARHVALLIAVMGEARALDEETRAAARADQPKASGTASLRMAT